MKATARLRARYLLALSMVACGGSSTLVSAPLSDSDAAPPPLPRPPPVATKKPPSFDDPPEPVRPPWATSQQTRCEEEVDAPSPSQLPSPFEGCPRLYGGGQFSAKETRARRREEPDVCCYVVFEGRPMPVPGRALPGMTFAMAKHRDDWSDHSTTAPGDWLQSALFEHASIASFARLALDLMAFGAPPDLIEDAHRAALDEIRHARICFGLAGGKEGPGPLVTPPGVTSLAELVRETIREGCVNETLAALRPRGSRASTPRSAA
jgi:hypothetical protein